MYEKNKFKASKKAIVSGVFSALFDIIAAIGIGILVVILALYFGGKI